MGKNVAYMSDSSGRTPMEYTLEKNDLRSFHGIAQAATINFQVNPNDGLLLTKNFVKDYKEYYTNLNSEVIPTELGQFHEEHFYKGMII